ncbi:hypothetical protein F2P81_020708 [Scophthalmus maximus]|uniref:Uncharacterized protein n=1 Tax=Scophthalmus maximus TaxID=52904 RepID=A0A6A4S4I8_SCOMX|nr:hypothetical protein F2P81_020708 [Scophthalmus maximus]
MQKGFEMFAERSFTTTCRERLHRATARGGGRNLLNDLQLTHLNNQDVSARRPVTPTHHNPLELIVASLLGTPTPRIRHGSKTTDSFVESGCRDAEVLADERLIWRERVRLIPGYFSAVIVTDFNTLILSSELLKNTKHRRDDEAEKKTLEFADQNISASLKGRMKTKASEDVWFRKRILVIIQLKGKNRVISISVTEAKELFAIARDVGEQRRQQQQQHARRDAPVADDISFLTSQTVHEGERCSPLQRAAAQ